MDEVARYNKERWEALAQAGVMFSRPFLELTSQTAREAIDPYGVMGDVVGKNVLCLAGGGGQQSAAFALLGANVTVLDLSDTMLQRDRETAERYHLTIHTEQGDMRDLSRFAAGSFDVVWHAWSLSFVPDPHQVFAQVAYVLRPGGLYRLECANPFLVGEVSDSWNGEGYLLKQAYVGGELSFNDPDWSFADEAGNPQRVAGPREFRHTLNTLVNGLVRHGFVILGLWEGPAGSVATAEPGTWEHFIAIAPPWLTFWTAYRPEVFSIDRSAAPL
jgi:SAM-dependent methyltransferase